MLCRRPPRKEGTGEKDFKPCYLSERKEEGEDVDGESLSFVTSAFVPQKLFSSRPFGMLFGRSVSPARSHCSRLPPFFFSSSPVILTPAQPPPPRSPHKHPRWSTQRLLSLLNCSKPSAADLHSRPKLNLYVPIFKATSFVRHEKNVSLLS